jgi:hypothetical protein
MPDRSTHALWAERLPPAFCGYKYNNKQLNKEYIYNQK